MYVGDQYDVDVVAPRAAGLQAAYLDRLGREPDDEPYRMTSLDQLPAILASASARG